MPVVFTAMSERALVFDKRDFRHRTILIYEAAAFASGRSNSRGIRRAYFVRTLISEGHISYPMSIRDKDGGWTTKLYEKEGLTNAIVTTTAVDLHNDNETRMLSIHTDDSRQQTQGVLGQIADQAAGVSADEIEYGPWHELARAAEMRQ